jgi:hypothetical protein
MNRKLTLSLDEKAIEASKAYASLIGSSVSALAERYFQSLSNVGVQDGEVRTVVDALSGVIEIPSDYDEKADYREARSRQ